MIRLGTIMLKCSTDPLGETSTLPVTTLLSPSLLPLIGIIEIKEVIVNSHSMDKGPINRREHWEQVYRTKGPLDLSWYQARPELSLDLIATVSRKESGLLDVGGGTSVLVDCLLDASYSQIGVLDISGAALAHTRARLGTRAGKIEWFEADVTRFEPPHRFDIWHDRAVFHFLTSADDRSRYVSTLRRTLAPGGHIIIATFTFDGPPKCSGLDVMRYDEEAIAAELGAEFQLRDVRHETHVRPWQTEQRFLYFSFDRQSR